MITLAILAASSAYMTDRPDALGTYMRCATPIMDFYPAHADISHTIRDVEKHCARDRTEAIKIFIPLWQAKTKSALPIDDEDAAATTILAVIAIERMKKEEDANRARSNRAPNQ